MNHAFRKELISENFENLLFFTFTYIGQRFYERGLISDFHSGKKPIFFKLNFEKFVEMKSLRNYEIYERRLGFFHYEYQI